MDFVQNNFVGGMVAALDPTKTPAGAYRVGVNCRIRDNTFVGAYRPTRITTVNSVHQALFVHDDELCCVIGGRLYRLDGTEMREVFAFPGLSATADVIYHEAVPAPTNFFMQQDTSDETYNAVVSQYPECIVLQDGSAVPVLLFPLFGVRRANTYAQWTFATPEYVPIGLNMAFSGKKLYILSPDRKRVYHSVSGRPLDFVLNIADTDGAKGGDAETTYVASAAAPITALIAAQGAGFLMFTAYQAWAAIPDGNFPEIFGEPYISANPLFPVGAVDQYGFTFANGESLFVTSAGIQSFNQVLQQLGESNNSPFGAAIAPYIVKPVDRAACCTVDDYVYIGVSTRFGDGIIVYDAQLGKFVGIDLVGKVKEFALLRGRGITRLFFITESNELFEMPLYSGERQTYACYFGEHSSQLANALQKADIAYLSFTDVQSSGDVTVRVFANRKLVATRTVSITAQRPEINNFDATPVTFALAETAETAEVVLKFNDLPFAYTYGFEVSCSADARLASIKVMCSEQTTIRPVAAENVFVDKNAQWFLALGNITPDVHNVGLQSIAVVPGRQYVVHSAIDDATLVNGGTTVKLVAGDAKRFVAAAEFVTVTNTMVEVFDYNTVDGLLTAGASVNDAAISKLLLLGDVTTTTLHKPLWTALEKHGIADIIGVKGAREYIDIPTSADYASYAGVPVRSVHETEFVDFYLMNIAADDSDNLSSTGPFARWLEAEIANRNSGKFIVLLVGTPPFSDTASFTPGTSALRWNFNRLGVDMVLSTSTAYERYVVDNVYYINVGTGSATGLEETTAGLAVPGVLKLAATGTILSAIFYDTNGIARDRVAILG